jgi:hypothetical protein
MRALRIGQSYGRLVALGIILVAPALGWAQDERQLKDKAYLENEYSKNSARRKKLLTGEESPGKGDEKIAEASAKYFVYRFTHATENPDFLHKQFDAMIKEASRETKNRAYIENYLGPALVKSMKDVLDRKLKGDRRAEDVQVSMLLPGMGKLTSTKTADAIGEYLAELTKDGRANDIVRLYALKGLKETMPIAEQPDEKLRLDLKDADQNKKRARDTKYVDALTTFIERPVNTSGITNYEEYAAIIYVRREAIVSLAQAGAPAVMAYPEKATKKPAPDGPVAPTLLKVLAGQLQPPPSPQEKIEAALGLCIMKHKDMPEYDPALATFLIGNALVELTNEYNKDLLNFKASKKLPFVAWKTEAKRLKIGLDAFVKNANTKQAVELRINAEPILDTMLLYDNAPVAALRAKVGDFRNAAAAGKVFKTLPNTKTEKTMPVPPAN